MSVLLGLESLCSIYINGIVNCRANFRILNYFNRCVRRYISSKFMCLELDNNTQIYTWRNQLNYVKRNPPYIPQWGSHRSFAVNTIKPSCHMERNGIRQRNEPRTTTDQQDIQPPPHRIIQCCYPILGICLGFKSKYPRESPTVEWNWSDVYHIDITLH